MDRNALIRALRDTAQSASNAIASNVSGPVDLIAAGLRGVGLPIPQNAIGGSQWMAEKGLTAPVQQGVAQVIGDTIGLAGPALVANYAPQIARALNRGAQNLAAGGAPALRGQMGGVYMGGPRQEALETAQRNAAKPVSEGGLGLPPNNTPMDRARAMGFNTNVFHGTAADISEFNPAMFGTNTRASGDELGIFTTAKTDLANQYAEIAGRGGWYGRKSPGDANVMPLLARMQSPKKYETASSFYKEADVAAANRALGEMRRNLQREGFDSVQVRPDLEEVVIFDPSNLRSRFAAFDPARINENDLLGRADPRLLGLMGLGAAGGLGAYNYMQGQ